MVELKELKDQLADAIAKGDDTAFMTIVGEIAKAKKDIAKAAADALQKEATQLAGARETLAASVYKACKQIPNLKQQLDAVKATGFTFKLDGVDAEGAPVRYNSVALSVPTVRHGKGGTTGGGKSKDEYGMSLQEIFDKFATAADKAKEAAATSNSAKWQAKNAVKKAAIADGKLKPAR